MIRFINGIFYFKNILMGKLCFIGIIFILFYRLMKYVNVVVIVVLLKFVEYYFL